MHKKTLFSQWCCKKPGGKLLHFGCSAFPLAQCTNSFKNIWLKATSIPDIKQVGCLKFYSCFFHLEANEWAFIQVPAVQSDGLIPSRCPFRKWIRKLLKGSRCWNSGTANVIIFRLRFTSSEEGLKIKGLDMFGYVYGLFIRNVLTISEKYLLSENVCLKRQRIVISHPITFNLDW